jgi:hypothetical protein
MDVGVEGIGRCLHCKGEVSRRTRGCERDMRYRVTSSSGLMTRTSVRSVFQKPGGVLTNTTNCHNDLVTESTASYRNLAALLRFAPPQRPAEPQVPHGKSRASSGLGAPPAARGGGASSCHKTKVTTKY